jgi:hypothetical protein
MDMKRFETAAEMAGAIQALTVAVGRLIANRQDTNETLDILSELGTALEKSAEEARLRQDHEAHAWLAGMAKGANLTAFEIGSEVGDTERPR